MIRVMRAAGLDWKIDGVASADAALRCLDERSYDMVITDLEMPGMDGLSLLQRVRELYPRAVRVIYSARTPDLSPEQAQVAHWVLRKSDNAAELIATIRAARDLRSSLSRRAGNGH